MAQAEGPTASWHALDRAQALSMLEVDVDAGLTAAEAARRLSRYGRNEISDGARRRRLELMINQFRSVLVGLLIVAALVSGVALGEWLEASVIVAIVVLNAALGYWQESRAESALVSLRRLTAPGATVIRDGVHVHIEAASLVPGDVLVLAAGDQVVADARVVDLAHLEADESTLTGESLPVAKQDHPVAETASLGDRRSMVHAGTVVSAGRGRAVVVATGRSTEIGRLARYLEEPDDPTPLQAALDRIGRRIAVLAAVVAVGIFGIGIVRDQPAESMFLTAVALAVAAIPEGLPAVVTVTLSRGVSHMAEENALVRRLSAVEALGAASVICTDKTGTLTRNRLKVQEVRFAAGTVDAASLAPGESPGSRFRDVAVLCSDARPVDGALAGDPTEVALIEAVDPALVDLPTRRDAFPRIDEVAFDSRRKRMSTLHREAGGYLLTVKGAPEVVLERCARVLDPTGPVELGSDLRSSLLATLDDMAARGLRTLALAYRTMPERPGSLVHAEEDLVLVGLAAMSDEVRREAAEAVAATFTAGIRVVMITGDHAVTARSVGRKVGILGPDSRVMRGEELATIAAEDLAGRIEEVGAFARVDPVDKVKIVRAWQSRGGIVAMTGDGVNDAPALRAADIGVAMGSGTDVAKDASDMVLADDNYATILTAVRAGRGIFSNLKKVVYFLLSANISEVLLMLFGFLLVARRVPVGSALARPSSSRRGSRSSPNSRKPASTSWSSTSTSRRSTARLRPTDASSPRSTGPPRSASRRRSTSPITCELARGRSPIVP